MEMQSTLNRLFEHTLTHGTVVHNQTRDKDVEVLFLKNSDKNSTDNKTTILYKQDANVEQGDEIHFGGKKYIAINKDMQESTVYYHTDLKELSTPCLIFDTSDTNNKKLFVKDAYVYDITSASISEGKYVTTVNGVVCVQIPDSAATANTNIGSYIGLWGYKYEISHLVKKNNICYIYGVYSSSLNFTETSCISGLDASISYEIGKTYTLSAVVTATDSTGTYTVIADDYSLLTYESLTPDIATVDGDQITFLSAGTAQVKCSFDYDGITGSSTFEYKAIEQSSYSATITCSREYIKQGGTTTMTAHLYYGLEEVADVSDYTITFTHEYSSGKDWDSHMTYNINGNVFKITTDNAPYYLTDKFILTVTFERNNSVIATETVTYEFE